VARRVKNFRHLVVDGAVDVMAEGDVGVLVVERLGLALCFALALLAVLVGELRSRWGEGVIVNVPGRWQ
jgi:hypothetical protein